MRWPFVSRAKHDALEEKVEALRYALRTSFVLHGRILKSVHPEATKEQREELLTKCAEAALED